MILGRIAKCEEAPHLNVINRVFKKKALHVQCTCTNSGGRLYIYMYSLAVALDASGQVQCHCIQWKSSFCRKKKKNN